MTMIPELSDAAFKELFMKPYRVKTAVEKRKWAEKCADVFVDCVISQLGDSPDDTRHEVHKAFVFSSFCLFGYDSKLMDAEELDKFLVTMRMVAISMEKLTLQEFKDFFPFEDKVKSPSTADMQKYMDENNIVWDKILGAKALHIISVYPNKVVQNVSRKIDEVAKAALSALIESIGL